MERYFEGNYRRMPEQNLAGARKRYDVSELINKVQLERKKRENARLVLEKTIIIQSAYRGHSCRKQLKLKFSSEFEDRISFITENSDSANFFDLCFLLKRLTYFLPQVCKGNKKRQRISPVEEDLNKFILVMKLMQNLRETVIETMGAERLWISRLNFFLGLNMRLIENIPDGAENNVPCLLYTVSIFSDVPSFTSILRDKEPIKILLRIWEALLNNGVINILLVAMNMKSKYKKEALDEMLEIQNKILQNLIRLITITDNHKFREHALKIIGITLIKPPLSVVACSQVLNRFKEIDGFPLTELCKVYLTLRDADRTPESLYRFLQIDDNQNAISSDDQYLYFKLLSKLLYHLINIRCLDDESDDDSDNEVLLNKQQPLMLHDSVKLLNSTSRTIVWVQHLNNILLTNNKDGLVVFCKCLYFLWLPEQLPLYSYRILKNVAFHSGFLKALWVCITSLERAVKNETPPQTFYTWRMLAHGVHVSSYEANAIIPLLTMFCFFMKHHLAILNDDLFYKNESHDHVPFRLNKIIEVATVLKEVAVGVISMAYPTFSFTGDERIVCMAPTNNIKFNLFAWRTLLEQVIGLLRIIHIRDTRRPFTKTDFWLTNFVPELPKHSNQIRALEELVPFASKPEPRGSFNVYEDRYLATLRYLPFVIDFFKRLSLYQRLIHDIKTEYHSPNVHQFEGSPILIRRNYIYEDAYEKLNIDEVDDIRLQIKIQLVSTLGIDEIGIDGGGLFREFLVELLQAAFDPNRGFFLMNHDNELYPNPKIYLIEEDYSKHYSFIGRMLGKALYDSILVEIPFAEFFLAKLLGNKYDSYMNGLASLDPDMYKNLMYLMNYSGDFAELSLYFTISEDDFGRRNVVDLKPNGGNIQVTNDNVFEYIHLVARYKIHTQISAQTQAFLDGLTSVIPQPWLAMFSTKELQTVISGSEWPIDMNDLRDFTIYSGEYYDHHPTIQMFWRIVTNFDTAKKSLLVKFVTSCPRPPLMGFKNLVPPFCIQYVESEDMLPTTSTCMNTLKLPNIKDEETMRNKLEYAISSGSGFELP